MIDLAQATSLVCPQPLPEATEHNFQEARYGTNSNL